jgi:hypothetical protein
VAADIKLVTRRRGEVPKPSAGMADAVPRERWASGALGCGGMMGGNAVQEFPPVLAAHA